MGCVTLPEMTQNSLPGINSWLRASALLPGFPVSVILGSRFAMATPIWALAACRLASAARTSGRCSTRCAGRLTGKSRGRRSPLSSNFCFNPSLGRLPLSATSRSRCCASCFCNGGRVALDLRQRGLLSDNIGLGDVTQLVLPLQQRKHIGLNLDDAARGGNLAAQRGLLHGCTGEV